MALIDEVCFSRVEDYVQLVPYDLPEPFTVEEFAKAVKEKKQIMGRVVHILNYLQVLERCENRGHAYTYRVKEP